MVRIESILQYQSQVLKADNVARPHGRDEDLVLSDYSKLNLNEDSSAYNDAMKHAY